MRGDPPVTSPDSVGAVSVEIIGDARGLAKSIRKEVEDAFKGLDVQKLIRDSVGTTTVRIPVEADIDTDAIPQQVRRTRVPKVPVELDPVVAAFQAEVRRQTAALARTVNAKIPVGADTSGLRADLGASIAEVQRTLKATVPTEPGAKAEYEAKLRALVESASAKVKANVKVEPRVSGTSLSTAGLAGVSGIFKGLIPDIGGVGQAVSGLTGGIQQFASVAAQGGSALGGSIAAAAGPIGTVIALLVSAATAMGALGAAAVFVVPLMTAVAGAAAAIPAALSGVGAAFGTLALGFKGIGEAFKPVTGGGGGGGGGSATNQARQVAAASRSVEAARRGIAAANRSLEASERGLAAAQRGVVQAQQAVVSAQRGVIQAELGYRDAQQGVIAAQQRAVAAQQAVNRARQEAKEDIDDLNRSLRGAKLSEEDAALGVTEALRALESAKVTGDIPSIQRADLAYREALQTLDEAKATTDDLQQATSEANKKGVDGSDKVTDALKDQADAYKGIVDAQQAVRDSAQGIIDAQNGVIQAQNGVLDATDSLKSAQDGVLSAQDGIKSATDGLKSAQDSLAQSQEKVGSGAGGVAKQVTKLAPAARAFVDAVKALKPAFEGLRLDVQQRLFEGLDRTVTNLGNAWIPALRVTLGSYADTFNGFFKNLGSAVTTPKFITDIQAGAEGFRQGFEAVATSITKSLVPAFGTLSKAAGPFLAALGRELAGIVTQFSNWVLQGEKTKSLTSFFDRAAKAMSSLFTTGKLVGAIIGDLFSIITGAQARSGTTPIDTFNNALASLDRYLRDPAHQQQIRDFIQGLADTVNSFGSKIQKISNFLEKLGFGDADTQGAKDKSSSIGADIGRALVAGLLAGIGEGMKQSLKAMFFFFTGTDPETFVGGLKEQFGIHSPSTLMAGIAHDVVDGFLQGITDKFKALQVRAGQIRTTVTTALGNAGTWLTTHGQNAVIGLGNGIAAQYRNLSVRAQGLRTTVSNALSTAGSWLYSHGQAVVVGLESGIQSVFGNLSRFMGNARIYVQNALSGAGSYLYQHGKAVIDGLISGISSRLDSLGNFLGDIGSFIQAHKGPIDKDRVLLVGAGQAIMGGLISGIGDKKDALASELADVTSLVAGTTLPGLGVAADAAISSSLSVASQKTLQIGWAPGASADPVLQAFRSLISVQYRGDVQAALGS